MTIAISVSRISSLSVIDRAGGDGGDEERRNQERRAEEEGHND